MNRSSRHKINKGTQKLNYFLGQRDIYKVANRPKKKPKEKLKKKWKYKISKFIGCSKSSYLRELPTVRKNIYISNKQPKFISQRKTTN